MAKVGKISPIQREYNDAKIQTTESSLSRKKLTRTPGTTVVKYPYKDRDNSYRTGLDPKAAYIQRIEDKTEKELEIKRVTELRDKLQERLKLDLSPSSEFWDYSKGGGANDYKHVQPAALNDDHNFFDFTDPWKELTFAWLRVHPTIAPSYQAWEQGKCLADTQFYVVDDEVETRVAFNKKQLINRAIIKFDTMTPDRKKRIARLMELPVTEDTREHEVYNLVDSALKQTEFKDGKYSGLDPVKIFHTFADMDEQLATVKDLVKQGLQNQIYRVKAGGRIFEGEYEVAVDEEALVKHLMDDKHQEDVIVLEKKIKQKKLAAV